MHLTGWKNQLDMVSFLDSSTIVLDDVEKYSDLIILHNNSAIFSKTFFVPNCEFSKPGEGKFTLIRYS